MKTLGRFVKSYLVTVVLVFAWVAWATYVSHKLGLTALYQVFAAALVWFPFYGLPGCFLGVLAYRLHRSERSAVSPPRRPSCGDVGSAAKASGHNFDDDVEYVDRSPWELPGESFDSYVTRTPFWE